MAVAMYLETEGDGYAWIESSNGHVPDNAVAGGEDINGEPMFVGRAIHEGDLIPGKIVPTHGVCYVSHGGGERAHRTYQALVIDVKFKWKRAAGGNVIIRALEAGRTADGEPLFVGRTRHEGSLVIGKIHPSHGVLYFPYGGEEHSANVYEILRLKKD